MLDPLSFVVGSAAVIAGKLVYDAAVAISAQSKRDCSNFVPPPPLPPPPSIKNKIKVRLFVRDMEAALQRSMSEMQAKCEVEESTKDESDTSTLPMATVPRCTNFGISDKDLRKIKLRPTQTKIASTTALVNHSPICSDCIAQKYKLRHIP
jgi:hypothetical protein